MLSSSIPLSLYIHIPWCVKKCPYCDFNSHAKTDAIALPEEQYIEALLRDLQNDRAYVEDRPLKSLFFGGGTPSLFSPASIEKIIQGVDRFFRLSIDAEITLEANPGTLEHRQFKDYVQAGINRVSLGAQSFQDDKLKSLGRIHSHAEIEKAIESLHAANLRSFNLDIMYGLPNQSVEEACQDIKTALSFSPPHLSWYNLTLEPNTIFYSKPPMLPNEDLIWHIQEEGLALLQSAGFEHYEVSAFAKPGHQCVHNLNYWEFGDYLGIGAGAHGKVTKRIEHQYQHSSTNNEFDILRTSKKRIPNSYMQAAIFLADERIIPEKELAFEFMLNALRLQAGFKENLFEARTGLKIDTIKEPLKSAKEKGLLIQENGQILPTALGKRFLNDLLQLFMK